MASGFKKKGASSRPQLPPSTKPSVHNGQLLVSTGVKSVDEVLGGGIAVGTVVLVEEDAHGAYARYLLRYFAAEGVVGKHEVLVATADESPDDFVEKLPGIDVRSEQQKSEEEMQEAAKGSSGGKEELKIAWRYKDLPSAQSIGRSDTPSSLDFCRPFDLTKKLDLSAESSARIHRINCSTTHCEMTTDGGGGDESTSYGRVMSRLRELVDSKFGSSAPVTGTRNVLRIAVQAAGSPFWDSDDEGECVRFLCALRGICRSSYAVAMVTCPVGVMDDRRLQHMRHASDTVIGLFAFQGTAHETDPAFRDHHGFFRLLKVPRLNSLWSVHPDPDLAFKLRRRSLVLERLHMRPEPETTAQRTGGSAHHSSSSASTTASPLPHAHAHAHAHAHTHTRSGTVAYDNTGGAGSVACQPGPPGKATPLDF